MSKQPIAETVAAKIKDFSWHAKGEAERALEKPVSELSDFIRQKAALISAHFLLPAGARVVDMGCGRGEVTYALALLNPRWAIIGFDHDAEAIQFAKENYRLPNLMFRHASASAYDVEDHSVDGIINSNLLHAVYSEAGYNQEEVVRLLNNQISKLKIGGTMLVRDYLMPTEGEFVLLELPNVPSEDTVPEGLSDADLLVRFSQTARPMEHGYEGFFIEEQMPKNEGTRLFRLPHKWAIEFVHRRHLREKWEQELKTEYTFFTLKDFRREFERSGMRMVFSAPHWNPWVVKNSFKGRFQLYSEDGKAMSPPATNHFIVAQKVADETSLSLEERRPSQKPIGDLQIMVVRDKKSGALHELVKRPGEYCDVVPYRITPDGRLLMYVRSGYPRPIVNAVLRGSYNLDGKKWSGHLIEPITLDTVDMTEDVEENRLCIFGFVNAYAKLRPKTKESWYVGETYYPSPDRIDEAIEPVFVEVENPYKTVWPIGEDKDVAFTELGAITELDATDIILASQAGLLPEPRLEIHAFELMSRYNIRLPQWLGEMMPEIPRQKLKSVDPEEVLKSVERTEFAEEKKGAVSLRPVKAVFVEEGRVGNGTRSLSAQDVEFVVTEDGIENIAIVIPVSRDWDDNLLVALEPSVMPVPNRMTGDGAMLNAPSFILPKDVRTIDDARAFVAKKFGVPTDLVLQMGESYFTHTGVTPQRVYPFMVAASHAPGKGRPVELMMIKSLWKLWKFDRFNGTLLKMMTRMQMMTDADNDMSLNRGLAADQKGGFSLSTEKEAVEARNTGYSGAQSRILGTRKSNADDASSPASGVNISVISENVSEEPVVKKPIGQRLMESYANAKKARHRASQPPEPRKEAPPPIKGSMNAHKPKPLVLVPKPPVAQEDLTGKKRK